MNKKDNKAVFTGKVCHGWEYTELFYKYRGYDYSITIYNNGYMSDKTPKEQHAAAQQEIDNRILHINDKPQLWNNDALKAFNEFYDYLDSTK